MARIARTFLHYEFDEERAERPVRFIENTVRLTKGYAGQKFRLRPWQKYFVRELFGWVNTRTGHRRYRRALGFLPRKNGKSHLVGGIGNYCNIGDGEPGASVICAANSRKQAGMVFNACADGIRWARSHFPELSDMQIVPSTKRIVWRPEGGAPCILEALSAEAGTAYGEDISCLIYDEIAFAKNRDLYDSLTSASGARKQPLEIFITTAGTDQTGIGYELYAYAKEVLRDPKYDPEFLPWIYELPKDEDWTDPDNWSKVNPAWGDFLEDKYLRDKFKDAQMSISEQMKFRRLHLNQWTQESSAWLDVHKWKQCATTEDKLIASIKR